MLPAPEEPSMTFGDRRAFFGLAGAAAVAGAVGPAVAAPPPSGIKSITGSAEPISAAERQARIARAQRLMRESGLSALLIEPGASLVYFTGGPWGRSERLTAAVLPVWGGIAGTGRASWRGRGVRCVL